MNELTSTLVIFKADTDTRTILNRICSYVGWSDIAQGEAGIREQAALCAKVMQLYANKLEVSGMVILIDKTNGRVINSAKF